jgi:hypothetical protein
MACGMTPYYLAFPESYNDTISYMDMAMNIFFGFDIIIHFFSA